MIKREKMALREKVLGKVLLLRFRSHQGDVSISELSRLFELESLPVSAKFFTYSAFSVWVSRHPDLTVEVEKEGKRKVSILRLDEKAAMFVGARTGESMTVDFEALRSRSRCMPIGDFSYGLEGRV